MPQQRTLFFLASSSNFKVGSFQRSGRRSQQRLVFSIKATRYGLTGLFNPEPAGSDEARVLPPSQRNAENTSRPRLGRGGGAPGFTARLSSVDRSRGAIRTLPLGHRSINSRSDPAARRPGPSVTQHTDPHRTGNRCRPPPPPPQPSPTAPPRSSRGASQVIFFLVDTRSRRLPSSRASLGVPVQPLRSSTHHIACLRLHDAS